MFFNMCGSNCIHFPSTQVTRCVDDDPIDAKRRSGGLVAAWKAKMRVQEEREARMSMQAISKARFIDESTTETSNFEI